MWWSYSTSQNESAAATIHQSYENDSLHLNDRRESFQISVSEICDDRYAVILLRGDENKDSVKMKIRISPEADKLNNDMFWFFLPLIDVQT